MPFPLNSLPIDCRYRLRELTTPGETYDLQIAAPFFNEIHSIQKVKYVPLIVRVFINDDNEFCAEPSGFVKLNNSELYSVFACLRVQNFTANHSAQLILNRFVINPGDFYFENCDVTLEFLQHLSTRCKLDTTFLDFKNCTFHIEVTLEVICTLFQKLLVLELSNSRPLNQNWIDFLIAVNYGNMYKLTIYDAAIDVLNVNESQLIKFVKAQRKTFKLSIVLTEGNDSQVKEVLNTLFNNRFWHLKDGDQHDGCVVIRWKLLDEWQERNYALS